MLPSLVMCRPLSSTNPLVSCSVDNAPTTYGEETNCCDSGGKIPPHRGRECESQAAVDRGAHSQIIIRAHMILVWMPLSSEATSCLEVKKKYRGIRGFSGTRCSVGHVELGMLVYLHICVMYQYYVMFSHRVPQNTVSH